MRPRSLTALFALAFTVAGCDGGSRMTVKVDRQGCTATCPEGMILEMVAYRVPVALDPCLLESLGEDISLKEGVLDDLPLVEGEMIQVAALAACVGNPSCTVCWDARQVQVGAGAEHQLALKNAKACIPEDITLVLVRTTKRFCP